MHCSFGLEPSGHKASNCDELCTPPGQTNMPNAKADLERDLERATGSGGAGRKNTAALGESRLKPYAADSIVVHAKHPERAGSRGELADNVHVVQVRHKRGLLARCINPLQHWLQRECEQQRSQGVALSHSTL